MKDLEGVKMTSTELRIRLNEFGKYFAGTIEETADEIIKGTDNVEVKRNALEWKINVIPQALASLVIMDPVAAGTDFYALCLQMDHFFRLGNGKNLFEEQQQLALNATEDILNEFRKVADDFRDYKDRDEIERFLAVWVIQNPIKNLKFNRKSTLDLMAQALGSEEYGLGSTVGSMAEGIHDLRRQVTIYTDFLPKHVKWQLEYELYNLMGDSTFENTFNNIDRVVYSTERITKVLEESPELLKELQKSTMAEVNKQLLITLSTLANERAIVLDAITAERVAIMQDIYQQRIETLDRIDTLAQSTINQSTLFAGDVIDKIFWRLLIVLGIVFIGGIIAIKLYRRKT
ncbi:MAG: hypothetical protein KJN64_07340 [Ignavibacteria bacterium]|nr:hypothetical protein [Ignavibacteria bacterium]